MVAARARAQWQSRTGFVLAALGAAIGLGNIWRFSFVVGDNGGGAFLIVYIVTIALVGLPLLLAEFAVGRATQREAASAFRALGRSRLWRQAGVLGVVVSFAILTYYAVIAGWALKHFVAFAGGLYPLQPGRAADYFQAFVAAPVEPVVWQALIMAASIGIVLGGIERGIERASKVLMPVLAAIVVGLAVHSLVLPGAVRGLAFLFVPDWSVLARPGVYLAALGQAFFSLGLAMGVLVTYGSYLPAHFRLPAIGLAVTVGDTLIALLAAIIIFPAVFSFGMRPDQGPSLAFITLPEIFADMDGGWPVGTAFFGLLVIAAVTSAVALLEIPVAYAIERWGMARRRAALTVGTAAFLLGLPSSLGFGPLAAAGVAGMTILDIVDFVASNVRLPLSGLAIALFVGWHWPARDAVAAAGLGGMLARLWQMSLRYLAPAVIAVILLRSLSLI